MRVQISLRNSAERKIFPFKDFEEHCFQIRNIVDHHNATRSTGDSSVEVVSEPHNGDWYSLKMEHADKIINTCTELLTSFNPNEFASEKKYTKFLEAHHAVILRATKVKHEDFSDFYAIDDLDFAVKNLASMYTKVERSDALLKSDASLSRKWFGIMLLPLASITRSYVNGTSKGYIIPRWVTAFAVPTLAIILFAESIIIYLQSKAPLD